MAKFDIDPCFVTHQNVEDNKGNDGKDNIQDRVHPKHINVQVPVVHLKSNMIFLFSKLILCFFFTLRSLGTSFSWPWGQLVQDKSWLKFEMSKSDNG